MDKTPADRDGGARLPAFKETFKTDSGFRKECEAFVRLCAEARAAAKRAEGLAGSFLHDLVFAKKNLAGELPAEETPAALARKGLVRRGLCNGDFRAAVSGLLAFAAAGGEPTDAALAAHEAAFEAAAGGPVTAVFRRIAAVAFPGRLCPVASAPALAAVHAALVAEGRAKPVPACADWAALGRAVHAALRAEWPWPDDEVRAVFARRLARAAVKIRPAGQIQTASSAAVPAAG